MKRVAVPPNGLVVYCGTVITEEGKEKKVNIDFEPFRPINTSLYLCDNRFHTEALTSLLQDDHKFGFIVMDGEHEQEEREELRGRRGGKRGEGKGGAWRRRDKPRFCVVCLPLCFVWQSMMLLLLTTVLL